ncbi:hypothetical protein CAEBREN_12319 [Caenorhabditis brenneri]|uniref:SPK domain-containing protein n=1 Tax=Caenorhabditis brenneri TaxID=135651 RepID=G0N1S0_CAEBE|nr:hypothetical protein CAEBREN_12319 [Caenorhabditis brenneri]
MADAHEKSYWSLRAMKRIFSGYAWTKKRTDHKKTVALLRYYNCPYTELVIYFGIKEHLIEMAKDLNNLEEWGFDIDQFVYLLFFLNFPLDEIDETLKEKLEAFGELLLDERDRVTYFKVPGKPCMVNNTMVAKFKPDGTHFAFKSKDRRRRRDRKQRASERRAVANQVVNNDSGEDSEESDVEQRPAVDYGNALNIIAHNIQEMKEEHHDPGRVRQANLPDEFDDNYGNEVEVGGMGVQEDEDMVDPMDVHREEEEQDDDDVVFLHEVVQNANAAAYVPNRDAFFRIAALLLLDRHLECKNLRQVFRTRMHTDIGVELKIYDRNNPTFFTSEDIKSCFDMFAADPITVRASTSDIVTMDLVIDKLQDRFEDYFPNAATFSRILRYGFYHPILEEDEIRNGSLKIAREFSNNLDQF